MPHALKIVITCQWRLEDIEKAYKKQGAAEQDWKAPIERWDVVDVYAAGLETRPQERRVDLCPKRVAATVVECAHAHRIPFQRQSVPAAAFSWGVQQTAVHAMARRRRASDPGPGPGLLDELPPTPPAKRLVLPSEAQTDVAVEDEQSPAGATTWV